MHRFSGSATGTCDVKGPANGSVALLCYAHLVHVALMLRAALLVPDAKIIWLVHISYGTSGSGC